MGELGNKVPLGRTGLQVSRLGVGSSYGVSRRACREAFDAGVNYFFWGSMRRRGMGLVLRELARTHRDELVIVLQCYSPWGSLVGRSVEQGLRSLGIDYADILLLGWHDRRPSAAVLEAARALQEAGRCRYLGISSHQRVLFPQLLDDGCYDVFHLRYNAAHRGAEQEVFPLMPAENAPGIVSFTNTRWGELLDDNNMPPGFSAPTAADCYRFVLSHPRVQVATTGPKNDDEMRHALTVLDRDPMDEEELQRMRTIGDHLHAQRSLSNLFR
jgi:aryl-alcohol dehydrogenase-like predicted oxidoreductase